MPEGKHYDIKAALRRLEGIETRLEEIDKKPRRPFSDKKQMPKRVPKKPQKPRLMPKKPSPKMPPKRKSTINTHADKMLKQLE